MKFIDEKGKLFGKLNVIDLLVILLLVAALALVGLKLSGRGGVGASGGTNLTYTVLVQGVEPDAYENLKSFVQAEGGDQLMANGELLNGYITEVTAKPSDANIQLNTHFPGDPVQVVLNNGTLDLTFTIHANVNSPVTSEVGTQEVRIGKNHIVKTTHFEFSDGIITDCEWTAAA